jgi:hypothetical protein
MASLSASSLTFVGTTQGSSSAALPLTLTNSGNAALVITNVTIGGTNPADFSQTNTCGTTLAAGTSCTISVTFTPQAVTSYTATLTVNDNASGSPQTATLSGSGNNVPVPIVALSTASLSFTGTGVNVTSPTQTVTLSNTGTATLTGIAISLKGVNPSSFAETNNCGSTVAAGASCTISLTFTPAAATTYTASLSVADSATNSPQTVALSGVLPAPIASLSPTTLNFTSTALNVASPAQTVTLSNTGNAPMTNVAISLTGFNPTNFAETNNCGSTVAVGANCTISVTFVPATANSSTASLTISDNAAGSPQTVTLAGNAVVPFLSFTPSTLNFGATAIDTTAAAQTITLTNTGSAVLNISATGITGTNPNSFSISSTTCVATLAVNASCTVSISFSPAASIDYAASLTVTDNAGNSPQSATLTGNGAQIVLTPSFLNFPFTSVGATSAAQVITVSNQGTTSIALNGVSLGGANPSSFAETTTCGSSLAAGASCPVSVTYTTGSSPSYTATVAVADSLSGSPQTATLQGLGPEPNNCKATVSSPSQPTPTANYAGHALTGTVMAGSLPVVGSSVQVYAAGMTGNGSTPTAMLATPLVTDSNGAFSVPATFTCPYSNSVLYAVARGGHTGTNAANSGIVLATVLGLCNSLTGTPSYTINEATTAATTYAMYQFLSAGGNIGATATNSLGIGLAAATAANLVNTTSGAVPGTYFPSTGTAPVAEINSLANLLNACTVSSGNTSSACTQLYAAVQPLPISPPVTNTFDAMLNVARNPGTNVASIYQASTAATVYTPVLSAQPPDWTMFVNYTGGGMSGPSGVAIDSTGRVWVGNYFYVASEFSNTGVPVFASGLTGDGLYNSYGAAVDFNDYSWIPNEQGGPGLGTVSVFNSSGAALADLSAGGFNFPIAITVDSSGLSWVVNYGDSTVTLLSNSGTPLSGTGGFTGVSGSNSHFFFPVAVAADAKCNSYIANQSSNTITRVLADGSSYADFVVGEGPSGVAVDGSNNAWSANYYGNSVGLVSAAGQVLSGAGYTGGGIDHPQGIAVDGTGTVWVASYRSPTNAGDALTELTGANTANPGTALSPATGWGTGANMLEAFALAIDSSGNIWVTNFVTNTLTEFIGMAAPVKTPVLGPVRTP